MSDTEWTEGDSAEFQDWSDYFVPERELRRLEVGQPARIVAGASESSRSAGSIKRIAPTIDPSSGTVKVTAAI